MDQTDIKSFVRLESDQGDVLVIAVNTDGKKKPKKDQKKWTAFMAPVARAPGKETPEGYRNKAHFYACAAVATRGRMLEKNEADFYFKKLKITEYQKKAVSR